MCELNLDICSVYLEKPVRARKPHRCDGCGRMIAIGEPYLTVFTVFDGSADTSTGCFGCWAAREQFAEAHGESFPPGQIQDMLLDCIGEKEPGWETWRDVLAQVQAKHPALEPHHQHDANAQQAYK